MPSTPAEKPDDAEQRAVEELPAVDAELFLVDRLPLDDVAAVAPATSPRHVRAGVVRTRRGRSPRARSTSTPRARLAASTDWSRLRVSRESVPVVARRRLAVKKTVTAATRRMMTMTMAMANGGSCSYSSKKMPSFQGKTKLKP